MNRSRTDHSSTRTTVLLSLLGLFVLALFTYQYLSIAQHDTFYVAHHFEHLVPKLKTLAYFFSGFLLALWLFLRSVREYSTKKFLAIIIAVTIGLAIVAIITHPTRSQDIYWSLLLGKGFSQYHLNPYQTIPEILGTDPWAYPVLTWKDIPMIYGPIWALIVSAATWLASSLGTALVFMKLLGVAILAISGKLLWDCMGVMGFTDLKKCTLLTLFLWNPFVIQITAVDVHNDSLLMLCFLASYLFLLKKNYFASIVALLAGGFVKYIPWLFILIPLYYLIKDRDKIRKYYHLGASALTGILLLIFLYAPFGGFSLKSFAGLIFQTKNIGLPTEYLPGTKLILDLFNITFGQLNWFGIILAIATMVFCLKNNKPLLAYFLPLLAIFFFASPWFQSWYGLWVLPMMILAWPFLAIVIFSIFLLFTPELVSPSVMSIYLPAYVFYAWAIAKVYALANKNS